MRSITSRFRMHGELVSLVCDGKCFKAWGIQSRPKVQLSDDPDDFYYLPDGELPEAPEDPGTYEGGDGKQSPKHSRWCARECERSHVYSDGEEPLMPDLSVRLYNQPWKHPEIENKTLPCWKYPEKQDESSD